MRKSIGLFVLVLMSGYGSMYGFYNDLKFEQLVCKLKQLVCEVETKIDDMCLTATTSIDDLKDQLDAMELAEDVHDLQAFCDAAQSYQDIIDGLVKFLDRECFCITCRLDCLNTPVEMFKKSVQDPCPKP